MLCIEFSKHKDSEFRNDGFTLDDFVLLLKNGIFPLWSENFNIYKNTSEVLKEIESIINKQYKNQFKDNVKEKINLLLDFYDDKKIIFKDKEPKKCFTYNVSSNESSIKNNMCITLVYLCSLIPECVIKVYDNEEKLPAFPIILKNKNNVQISIDVEKIKQLLKKQIEELNIKTSNELDNIKYHFKNVIENASNLLEATILNKEYEYKTSELNNYNILKTLYKLYLKISEYKTILSLNLNINININNLNNINNKYLTLLNIKINDDIINKLQKNVQIQDYSLN